MERGDRRRAADCAIAIGARETCGSYVCIRSSAQKETVCSRHVPGNGPLSVTPVTPRLSGPGGLVVNHDERSWFQPTTENRT